MNSNNKYRYTKEMDKSYKMCDIFNDRNKNDDIYNFYAILIEIIINNIKIRSGNSMQP